LQGQKNFDAELWRMRSREKKIPETKIMTLVKIRNDIAKGVLEKAAAEAENSMKAENKVTILGIESSCDETGGSCS
jgi:hypothetical protein